MSQAESTPTTFDYESLNTLSADLTDHADSIENITAHQLETDIRKAAQVVGEHAKWRFAIAELAASLPAGNFARNELLALIADSDEAGHAFQIEAGHPFRFEAGHCSDLKSATWRHSAGREDVVLVFRPGSSAGSTERKEQVPLARREAVPVVNRRDPRATRRALAADAASRAGGPC